MYNSDPFFKEKVDNKIIDAHKRIAKNPSLGLGVPVLSDMSNISFKENKTLSDREFVEECLFY